MAMPRIASWRLSCPSTSATETLKLLCSRSLMLFTTCRLSSRLRDSRSSRRMRRVPTIMMVRRHPGFGTNLLQRPLHLLDAERFDDIADLDVVIAGDLDA